MSEFTYEDLLRIVELIDASERFSEFHLKIGDIALDLRKAPRAEAGAQAPVPARQSAAMPGQPGPAVLTGKAHAEPVVAAAMRSTDRASGMNIAAGSLVVASPMVGTFYRAPEPGARPFVEIGERVQPDTTVCIIEVMKLMNSLPAGHAGVVTHVLVENAQPVEAGQPLIIIDPNSSPG